MSTLQAKRVPATRQAVQHLVDMMSGLSCEGEQGADLLDALDGMLESSLYAEYGSVGLGDIAHQMRDDIEGFEEPQHCTACNGSGEGQYDGTRCSSCNGKGQHPSPKELAEREHHDY